HDVAVIELKTPLKFSKKIQPIKLPTEPVTNSKWVFVARGSTEDAYVAVNLQKVDLIRYPIDQCYIPLSTRTLLDKDLFKKITICATREGDRASICAGDSGSPLISGKTIVGIASYMKNEPCYEARIGYYVNVSYYVPWIKNVTGLYF
ncbi:venom prothrombin activator vestarin-D1-like, partial [Melitaea cinxia]|uniref:venom prothrombin activator vestarin-D1-like n=1 Tax=Melitaea cinxia TaxID=113334 RepID=UPI001E270A97